PDNSTEPVNDWASTNVDVQAIAAQPDGKILIGGGFTTINGETQYRVGRLNADGTRDASFGAR
ncbi:MAG: hypothetical protein GWN30_08070, partial [Gammaproteobacteria bacterium]|nr:hypothetical protein [Gammaproteobacteria bacterium]